MSVDEQTNADPTKADPSVNDRATTFQAVTGNEAQHYSGEVLLVCAYALVWVLLLGWVAFVWRRQRALDVRLADLERVLDKAATAPQADTRKSGE